MPTSFLDVVPEIIGRIQSLEPTTVLDVGAGYGKYGLLIREYVDTWPWKIKIDGLEPFPYPERMGSQKIYNCMFHADFNRFYPNGYKYDLVLMIDVVEHFDKDNGYMWIRKALNMAGHVLISTPTSPAEQGAEYGNEYERHRSAWTHSDFNKLGFWEPFGPPHVVAGVLS